MCAAMLETCVKCRVILLDNSILHGASAAPVSPSPKSRVWIEPISVSGLLDLYPSASWGENEWCEWELGDVKLPPVNEGLEYRVLLLSWGVIAAGCWVGGGSALLARGNKRAAVGEPVLGALQNPSLILPRRRCLSPLFLTQHRWDLCLAGASVSVPDAASWALQSSSKSKVHKSTFRALQSWIEVFWLQRFRDLQWLRPTEALAEGAKSFRLSGSRILLNGRVQQELLLLGSQAEPGLHPLRASRTCCTLRGAARALTRAGDLPAGRTRPCCWHTAHAGGRIEKSSR